MRINVIISIIMQSISNAIVTLAPSLSAHQCADQVANLHGPFNICYLDNQPCFLQCWICPGVLEPNCYIQLYSISIFYSLYYNCYNLKIVWKEQSKKNNKGRKNVNWRWNWIWVNQTVKPKSYNWNHSFLFKAPKVVTDLHTIFDFLKIGFILRCTLSSMC